MPKQTYEALIREIERIVNAPYPTQLRSLRDLLCKTCTAQDLSRWILSKPCQLDSLVRNVLDGLRQWSYVLDIVTKLSRNIKARDALLSREPTLLRDITVQAIQTGDVGSRYIAAAVTLLSHPFPENTALPSEVQTLFIQIFDHAAQYPSVMTIRPIYRVLQGTSTLLLGVVSSNVLLRFEDHLFGILRNLKGDDPSLSLYCLAIMKILATVSDIHLTDLSTSSYDTQELLASTQLTTSTKWRPETVRQYFTARKAQKTMQLIVLRVMYACTPTTAESTDEKMESLELANEIIAAVPALERETWRKANVLVPKKFEEKISEPSMEPALRFQALCFLVRLAEGSVIPAAVIDGLRQIVVKLDKINGNSLNCSLQSVECLVNSGVFDQNTTITFLQNVVDFIASTRPDELIEESRLLMNLLQQLFTAVAYQDTVAEGCMLALDVLSCGPKLQSLARMVRNPVTSLNNGSQADMCLQAFRSARNGLINELCSLFLRAALCTGHQNYSVAQNTISLLLELHSLSAQSPLACPHEKATSVVANPSIAFVEAESTPVETPAWREELRSELNARASSEHERLVKLFAKSCEKLEARCHDVEKPLREAQSERCALQNSYEELQHQYATLESESIDRTVQFNALEAERDQCFADLDTVRAENEQLSNRCEELEQKLADAEENTARDVNEGKQALETTKLGHAAILARKEEQLEDLQAQLQSSKEELQTKIEELGKIQNELGETKGNLDSSRQELEQMSEVSKQAQANIDSLTSEKDDLLKNNEQLETQVASIRTELDNEQRARQASINRKENEARENLASAQTKHRQEVVEMATEHESIVQYLKRKLSEIDDELRRSQGRHISDIEERDFEISDKQKRLDRLIRKCEQKDKQIAEAKAMRNNLMAAMGLLGTRTPTALPHRPSPSSATQTVEESQEDPSPPTPFSGDDADGTQEPGLEQSFASNVSSNESRSGPTPKRPKPKRPSKATSSPQPRLRTSTVLRSGRRQPLLKIDANPSTKKKVAPKTPSNGKAADLDETTSSGSQFFAGTSERIFETGADENVQERL